MFKKDLKQKVLSGLGWSVGARFFARSITWIITIVVIRLLNPQDYGLMAMAGVFIAFLTMLNELGLGVVLIQRPDLCKHTLRQIFGLLVIVNSFLFLFVLALAPFAAGFFDEQRIVPIMRFLSAQFLITSFAVIPRSLIVRDMLFKEKSLVDLVSAIMSSLITLLLALKGWGVWSLVWGTLTLNLCLSIGFNIIRPYFCMPLFSFKGIKEIISFGGYVTITQLFWFFYTQIDVFIVGKLLGKQMLGFYSVGATLSSLPMEKVSGIINQVAFPAFASIQTDIRQVASHFQKAIRMMAFIAFPILWGISSIAPEIVRLFLGEKWLSAIMPFQILSLVIPVRMLSNLMNPALVGIGHPKTHFLNVLTASIVMPIGILIGSFYWGIIGTSLAWAITFPVVFLFNLSRTVKVLKIRLSDVLTDMFKPLLTAFTMYASVRMISISFGTEAVSIAHFVLLIIAGMMIYSSMIFILDRSKCIELLRLVRPS